MQNKNNREAGYIIYTRIPTQDQHFGLASLGMQERECREYAKHRSLPIQEVVSEVGQGPALQLKELACCVQRIEAGHASGIILHSLGVVACDMRDVPFLVQLAQCGAPVHVLGDTHPALAA
jgi:DNA invertase Pin-like site-specific DNA recombinase